MNINEDIIGMLHRVLSLTRRGIRHHHPEGGQAPAHSCLPHTHEHGPSEGGCGISFRERGRLLIELERRDGLTQRALAEILNIRPQSLSELVFKLEQDGLVERRMDETDKRAVQVFLSAKGRARLDFIKQERCRFAEEFLSPLTAEEKAQLSSLLNKIIDAHTQKDSEPQE